MRSASVLLSLATVLGLTAALIACEWDYDTLQMERMRFPETLELMTGKFLRHSEEFYQWRIEDRLKRLEQEPENLALYDDLAVAYDKTGQQEKAIETILKKEELQPGLYETYANLGTFHIHAGRLEEGVTYLKKAIEINPDAHFGREIYQQYLVEYLISKRDEEGKLTFPLDEGAQFQTYGFAKYVLEQPIDEAGAEATAPQGGSSTDALLANRIQPALKGVLGMMRFGHYDSPVLLEALGDLLMAGHNQDAKRLAARAYLKASYEVEDEQAKEAYRKKAAEVVSLQTRAPREHQALPLEELEREFQTELKEAEQWWQKLRANELLWIQDSQANPDEMFTKTYYREPEVGLDSSRAPASPIQIGWWALGLLAVALGIAFVFTRLRSAPHAT